VISEAEAEVIETLIETFAAAAPLLYSIAEETARTGPPDGGRNPTA